jgi:hypothetical protein
MRSLALTGLLVAGAAAAGEPLLVPDFTPASTSEFALAFMLQEQVMEGLRAHGHIVLDNRAVAPVVGDSVTACADVPGCPFAALQQLPARAAVVGRVARNVDGALTVYVAAYEQGDSRPVDTRELEVVGGYEAAIADEVVRMVDDMLSLLGPAHAEDLVRAVELLEAADAPPVPERTVTSPPPTGTPEPRPPAPPPPVAPAIDWDGAPIELLLEGSVLEPRHLIGGEMSFRRQRRDAGEWMRRTMPHAGRVIIELRGGVGIGDVDRHADVRVALAFDGQNASEWLQEGPEPGQQPRGSIFLGYAPSTWFDFGLGVGLQYGERGLTTGYTTVEGDESAGEDVVPAAQMFLHPRLRAYLVPLGPVKPYLFVGGEVRLFDPYDIIDPPSVDYPNPPGGVYGGPLGGAGLLIDPGPVVGFFAEGSYTQHFGVRASAAQLEVGDYTGRKPAAPVGDERTIAIVGGVQFRI